MHWLILIVAAAWLFASPIPALAQDNAACLACHQVEGTKVTFPGGGELDVTINPDKFAASVHASFTCTTCHTRHADYPHPPRTANTARAYRVTAQEICAGCHADQQRDFDGGVHGGGVRMGLGDVPLCTTCHTAHAVIKPKSAAFRNSIPEVCGNCHADEAVMRRYGLRPVYQAYLEEFHGVTTRLYRIVTPLSPSPAAVCYDCHTAHRVLRVANPLSPVAPGNLLATCRQCHTTAGRFFATAWTEHRAPSLQYAPLVYLVQVFYLILIPAVVGVLALLTVLDLWHWAVTRWGGGGA
ncbi:MAG: cytochrome c3 family protein [Armatimonadota bacterium]|nr:cytochrome c3 family protein [Armatimonadota bacterium]